MSVAGDDCTKPKSVQRYAADLLGETLVTGVPNIIKTTSWVRKALKFSVLTVCIIGFLYQTTEFIIHVLSYPSIVDIYVYTPTETLFPAITICNTNGIKRSKFCEKYPERCETPVNQTLFCSKYPYYCTKQMDWKNFKVPKVEFHSFEINATLKDLIDLGHEQKTLFEIKSSDINPNKTGIEGPFIFFKNMKACFACYTIHFRANSSLDPAKLEFNPFSDFSVMELEIDFEPSDTFLPGRKPGGFVAIHSPFEFFNPFDFGHRIKPGRLYKIHMKMEEEKLLPNPYRTDCLNYTQVWEDNGRKGPRSQEMCKLTCLFVHVERECNCSFKFVNFPYKEDVCFADLSEIQCALAAAIDECVESCKEDCEKHKFNYEVQDWEIEEIAWESEEDKEEQKTYLNVFASDPEIVVYNHRPQYQNIEVFSYIGGYVGIWLGISLVAVVDFMECLLLILVFAFRRKKYTDREQVASRDSK